MLTNHLSQIIGVAAVACSILIAVPANHVSARIEPGDIAILQNGIGNRQMQIGYNPDRNEYLAAWHTDTSGSPATAVYAVVLDAAGTPKGGPVVLAQNPPTGATGLLTAADFWRPDVSYNAVTKQYLVTIMRNGIEGRRVTPRPVPPRPTSTTGRAEPHRRTRSPNSAPPEPSASSPPSRRS